MRKRGSTSLEARSERPPQPMLKRKSCQLLTFVSLLRVSMR